MGRSGKRAGTLSSLSVTTVPLRDGKVASAMTGHSPAATTCERSHFPISFHSSFFFLLLSPLFIFLLLLLFLLFSQSLAIHAVMALPASLVTGEN